MQTENSFPSTRQDLDNLKRTASDAAADLGSTAGAHLSKAKSQFGELADHAQQEGADQWNQVQGSFSSLVSSGRDYVSANPITCLGVALGVGLLVGFSARGNRCE